MGRLRGKPIRSLGNRAASGSSAPKPWEIVQQNSTVEVAFRWSCKLRGGKVPHHASTTVDVRSGAEAAIGQAEVEGPRRCSTYSYGSAQMLEWTNAGLTGREGVRQVRAKGRHVLALRLRLRSRAKLVCLPRGEARAATGSIMAVRSPAMTVAKRSAPGATNASTVWARPDGRPIRWNPSGRPCVARAPFGVPVVPDARLARRPLAALQSES